MRNSKIALLLLLALTVVMLALVSCDTSNQNNDSSTTEPGTTQEQTQAPTQAPTEEPTEESTEESTEGTTEESTEGSTEGTTEENTEGTTEEGTQEHEHVFSDATCTAPKTCACGATEGEALGHTEVEDAAVEPTCTETGLTAGVHCSVCDEVITAQTEVAALGHKHEAVVTAPTCTEAGYTTYTCICGDTYTADEVAALGHKHEVVVTAPTCTEAGYTTYTCVCGDTYTADEVAALGHKHEAVVTAPTCTEAGYTSYTCACGDTYTADEVAASHTLDANGLCTVCGTKTAVIPEIGKGYIFGMTQKNKNNTVYYLKGGMDGYYMATTTNPEEAISVFLEATEGGYYLYTIENGVKTYINMVVSGTHVNGAYEAVASTVYTIDEQSKTLIATVNGEPYWFGTRNDKTYTTMGPCKTSFQGFYGEFYFVHEHKYEQGEVVAPTCEQAGYTPYVCACGDSYKADEVDALGHSYVDGKCECGAEDPDYQAPVENPNKADFNTIVINNTSGGDSSYNNTYTTTNGWTTLNAAIQTGGATVLNPAYPVVGADKTFKAVCLTGKTSAPGKLTSPTLSGGISQLTLVYTKMFTDTQLSVTITVTEIATGKTYTTVVEREVHKSDDKYVVWTYDWVLETPVSGDFTIEVVNNCPSNNATAHKDRLTILELSWIGAHTHDYEVVTTATCTTAGTTTYTCACGDTYTEEVEKLGHVDADLDVSCDREGCTGKVAPAADSTLSVFTANNLGSKLSTSCNYYVEGTIVEVLDAKSGIFLLSDGTDETFYFRLPKDAAGTAHANWDIKLMLGDKVRLYGKVNKYSTSSAPNGYYPTMQGALVEILEQHPHDFSFAPANCTDCAYCACGQGQGEALGHIDEDADNICDRCGVRADSKQEEIRTHYNDIKDTANFDTTAGTATWNGTEFDVVVNKGSSSLNTNSSNYYRVQNGNILTVAAKNGKQIISITFIATSASYVDELQLFLTSAGYTHTTNDLEVTIQVDSLESVELVNSSKKVARIASVEVVYVDAPAVAE